MRHQFPTEGQRLIYRHGIRRGTALTSLAGTEVTIHVDQAATIPANITDLDVNSIASSTVVIDVDSKIPLFLGPDGATRLYGLVAGDDISFVIDASPADVVTDALGQIDAAISANATALTGHVTATDPHGDRAYSTTQIATEATARQAADVAVANGATAEIAQHISNPDPHGDRAAATTALNTAIATRETPAGAQAKVTAEANARIAADAVVAATVTTEANARSAADTTINTRIDGLGPSNVGAEPAGSVAPVATRVSTIEGVLPTKADLVAGTVPANQLPAFVDDVVEYDTLGALPVTGETGKIYVTIVDGLTYRWSGSTYTEISKSLALGVTSATAHRGDQGQSAYDHSLLTTGNPHSVTKAQVGLGAVDNTADLTKPVSTATQTAITAEATARSNADATLSTNLTTETGNRQAADATLTTSINSEITNRQNAVTAETNARVAADGTLATNLATEVTNRTSADASEVTARNTAIATAVDTLTNKTLGPIETLTSPYDPNSPTSGPVAAWSPESYIAGVAGGPGRYPNLVDSGKELDLLEPSTVANRPVRLDYPGFKYAHGNYFNNNFASTGGSTTFAAPSGNIETECVVRIRVRTTAIIVTGHMVNGQYNVSQYIANGGAIFTTRGAANVTYSTPSVAIPNFQQDQWMWIRIRGLGPTNAKYCTVESSFKNVNNPSLVDDWSAPNTSASVAMEMSAFNPTSVQTPYNTNRDGGQSVIYMHVGTRDAPEAIWRAKDMGQTGGLSGYQQWIPSRSISSGSTLGSQTALVDRAVTVFDGKDDYLYVPDDKRLDQPGTVVSIHRVWNTPPGAQVLVAKGDTYVSNGNGWFLYRDNGGSGGSGRLLVRSNNGATIGSPAIADTGLGLSVVTARHGTLQGTLNGQSFGDATADTAPPINPSALTIGAQGSGNVAAHMEWLGTYVFRRVLTDAEIQRFTNLLLAQKKLTADTSDTGPSLDANAVKDTIGTALTDTGTVDLAYDGAARTITANVLDSPKLAGQGSAYYRSVDNLVDSGTKVTMLAAERTKLAGIANGANVIGQPSSVDGEIALFSGTSGKTVKRANTNGLLQATNGVIAAAVAGTDYLVPGGSGSALTGITQSQIANLPGDLTVIGGLPSSGGNDTAAIQSVIDTALATNRTAVLRGGTYQITSTIELAQFARLEALGSVTLVGSVANGPVLRINGSNVRIKGHIYINGSNATNSVGFALSTTASCSHCDVESIDVTNTTTAVRLESAGVANHLMNRFGKVRAQYSTTGLLLKDTGAAPQRVNANSFDFVSVQHCQTGVLINGADGNSITFLEAEANDATGAWGLDIVKAKGLMVPGGWIEGNTGNVRIANDPTASGTIEVMAKTDSPLNDDDPKFSHTNSSNRTVRVNGSTGVLVYGRERISGTMAIGRNGQAANDQDVASSKLAVVTGIDCYRRSAASPYFLIRGGTGTGFLMSSDNGATTFWDMTATRLAALQRLQVEKSVNLAVGTQTVSSNGPVIIDAAAKPLHRIILQANITSMSIINGVDGHVLRVELIQDATGGRTYQWPSNFQWGMGTAPSATTANKRVSVAMVFDGTNWHEYDQRAATSGGTGSSVNKATGTFGDGVATSFDIAHNLNLPVKASLAFEIWNLSTSERERCAVTALTANSVRASGFEDPPATNSYQWVAIG